MASFPLVSLSRNFETSPKKELEPISFNGSPLQFPVKNGNTEKKYEMCCTAFCSTFLGTSSGGLGGEAVLKFHGKVNDIRFFTKTMFPKKKEIGKVRSALSGGGEGKDISRLSEETGIVLFESGANPALDKFWDLKSGPPMTPFGQNSSTFPSLQKLGKEEAMGIVLQAAFGTGWTTKSGLEGGNSTKEGEFFTGGVGGASPSTPFQPLLSKSPRRRIAVEFTCNKCGERTTRAINPHAYKEGTVFVQCKGCDVFHKLVDNLNLFHELKGPVFGPSYKNPNFTYHQPYDPFGPPSL